MRTAPFQWKLFKVLADERVSLGKHVQKEGGAIILPFNRKVAKDSKLSPDVIALIANTGKHAFAPGMVQIGKLRRLCLKVIKQHKYRGNATDGRIK